MKRKTLPPAAPGLSSIALALACLLAQARARAWAGSQAPPAAAPSLEQAQQELRRTIAASKAEPSGRYGRLLRLLPALEELEMRINSADLEESASRPQGLSVVREDRGCGYKDFTFGECWEPNLRFSAVTAFKREELLSYHGRASASLQRSEAAALELLTLLVREKADPAYNARERAVLTELAEKIGPLISLDDSPAPELAASHEAYRALFARHHPDSGLLELKDDQGFRSLIAWTSRLLRANTAAASYAVEAVSALKEIRGGIIFSDREALDAALADPTASLLLFFGRPGAPADAAHLEALKVAEDWNKVFLIADPSVLSDKEKSAWFRGDGSYVALSRKKLPVAGGPVAELYESDGLGAEPSATLLAGVLARMDCGGSCRKKCGLGWTQTYESDPEGHVNIVLRKKSKE